MRFRDKLLGIIEIPKSKIVIDEYKNNPERYEVLNGANDNGLSYNDLKQKATDMGLEFKSNIKKADLEKLIADNESAE